MLLMAIQFAGNAQNTTDLAKISEVVHTFSTAGDKQDASLLETVLHPQFRAVVHRFMGAPDVSLMDRANFLQLLRDKKIGGDKREVHILHTEITNNIATVKAILEGKALRFTNYISLVKLEDGSWQIVGDMPDVEKL